MNMSLPEGNRTNDNILKQIENSSEEVIKEEYVEQAGIEENRSVSSSFNPSVSNEMGLFTNQELLRRQHLATETEKVRDKVKTLLTTIKNGIRSMGKMDIVLQFYSSRQSFGCCKDI